MQVSTPSIRSWVRAIVFAAASLAGIVARASEPQVVYVNYSDGTTELVMGSEDATRNRSSLCGVKAYPAWAGDEARKRELQTQLGAMMADFNVVLTARRPLVGAYTMVMVGPGADVCGIYGAGGIAPVLDCDNRNKSNVCFDFAAVGSLTTIAQELGHTFGLAHVDVACDVMGASYTGHPCVDGNWRYVDESSPIIGSTPCAGRLQNSYVEMKRVLGAWPGGPHPDPVEGGMPCTDGAPPTIKVTEPAAGARTGTDFDFALDIEDDCFGVDKVTIDVPDEHLRAEAIAPPWRWHLDGLTPRAALTIQITATDKSGKVATATHTVAVDAPAAPDGGDGGGSAEGGGCGVAPVSPCAAPCVGLALAALACGRRRGYPRRRA